MGHNGCLKMCTQSLQRNAENECENIDSWLELNRKIKLWKLYLRSFNGIPMFWYKTGCCASGKLIWKSKNKCIHVTRWICNSFCFCAISCCFSLKNIQRPNISFARLVIVFIQGKQISLRRREKKVVISWHQSFQSVFVESEQNPGQ